MKIVFNIILAVAISASFGRLESSAQAEGVFFCTRELLADFFRTSDNVTFKKVALTDADRTRIQRRLGYVPARSTYTFYVAQTGSHVDGYALIDEEKGEHLPITFAVKLSPLGVIERHEVIAYRESFGEEVRDARFRKQFVGKSVRDPIHTNDDIIAISGATISSQAMAVGVKRAVILLDELVLAKSQQAAQVVPRNPGS